MPRAHSFAICTERPPVSPQPVTQQRSKSTLSPAYARYTPSLHFYFSCNYSLPAHSFTLSILENIYGDACVTVQQKPRLDFCICNAVLYCPTDLHSNQVTQLELHNTHTNIQHCISAASEQPMACSESHSSSSQLGLTLLSLAAMMGAYWTFCLVIFTLLGLNKTGMCSYKNMLQYTHLMYIKIAPQLLS